MSLGARADVGGFWGTGRAGQSDHAVILGADSDSADIIKPVREALILSQGGAEIKSYSAAGQALLLLGVVPLYAALASRLSRRRLINYIGGFFITCLGLFYLLAQFQVPLGVAFFLWVGIFNVVMIAQFWSFANDLYTPKRASASL